MINDLSVTEKKNFFNEFKYYQENSVFLFCYFVRTENQDIGFLIRHAMKIANKLIFGFLTIVGLLALIGMFGSKSIRSSHYEYNKLANETLPVIESLNLLRLAGQSIIASTHEYCFIKNEANSTGTQINLDEELSKIEQVDLKNAKTAFFSASQNYEDFVRTNFADEIPLFEKIKKESFPLLKISDELIKLKKQRATSNSVMLKKEELEKAAGNFMHSINLALKHENKEVAERKEILQKLLATSQNKITVFSLASLVIAAAISIFISSYIAKNLNRLRQVADEFGKGNFEYRTNFNTGDEIGYLARSFYEMAKNLKTSLYKENILAAESAVATANIKAEQEKQSALKEIIHERDQEIEERERVESILREREELFSAVFDYSAIGITLANIQGRILRINPAFQKMLGYQIEELKNKYFKDLTHHEDQGMHVSKYEEMISGQQDHVHMTKRYVHKNGRSIAANVTLSVVRDIKENPQYIIGIVEDIEVHRELEEERNRLSKLESIGLLAGGIAHDFNNLLTAILGNISLAMHEIVAEDKVTKRLTAAEHASLRAKDLTQQLLTFSKGGTPVRKTISISSVIKDCTNFMLSGSNITVDFDIPTDTWSIKADEGKISQVFQNIVSNSKQAMEDGGVIHITLENSTFLKNGDLPLKPGKYVKISFEDQGCGIPKNILPNIFDPYFSTKEKGSGLGLASSYSIVDNHEGCILVESEINIGTTVTIYLPALGKTVLVSEEKELKIITGKGRILLMDDEEFIRSFASATLKEAGYEVVGVEEGNSAINQYKIAKENGTPFDAVILDITVPGGMGGKEAIQELRAFDPEVKAIVSSGYSKDPIMAQFKKYGFSGVVPKPYKIIELCKTVRDVIKDEAA